MLKSSKKSDELGKIIMLRIIYLGRNFFLKMFKELLRMKGLFNLNEFDVCGILFKNLKEFFVMDYIGNKSYLKGMMDFFIW